MNLRHLARVYLKSRNALDLLLAFVLVIVAVYFGSDVFSPVRFDREKIEVWAVDGQIQVRGLYHYRNRFPLLLSFSLGLPFPTDATHPVPSTFSIAEVSADGANPKEIQPRNYHGGIVFRLWFAPRQEKWIRVDYIQGALQPNGRYILLTTRKWSRPLDFGEYILHLTGDSALSASNYLLEPKTEGHETRYSFSRSDFYPGEDWEFSWKTPTPLVATGRAPH